MIKRHKVWTYPMPYRIIYMSRATRPFEDGELSELCRTATTHNLRNAITGLFLYDGSRFLQAIEGEREAVEALMGRISIDSRHESIVIVDARTTLLKEFPNWSMEDPLSAGRDHAFFLNRVKYGVDFVKDSHLKAHFIGFARMAVESRQTNNRTPSSAPFTRTLHSDTATHFDIDTRS